MMQTPMAIVVLRLGLAPNMILPLLQRNNRLKVPNLNYDFVHNGAFYM